MRRTLRGRLRRGPIATRLGRQLGVPPTLFIEPSDRRATTDRRARASDRTPHHIHRELAATSPKMISRALYDILSQYFISLYTNDGHSTRSTPLTGGWALTL